MNMKMGMISLSTYLKDVGVNALHDPMPLSNHLSSLSLAMTH